jgi:hypothetical protein
MTSIHGAAITGEASHREILKGHLNYFAVSGNDPSQ